MTINDKKIVKRWDSVMCNVGCEHITIDTSFSELETHKDYYCLNDGIDIEWMVAEARYWLSCYYESGNARCDDRFDDKYNYKIWLSETGKLKRLVAKLEQMENKMVVNW